MAELTGTVRFPFDHMVELVWLDAPIGHGPGFGEDARLKADSTTWVSRGDAETLRVMGERLEQNLEILCVPASLRELAGFRPEAV
jgi:hypothetical protein